jgi:tetratricopeptide (TPR) repeat protein
VTPAEPTDAADGRDDFAAGWLLACKAFLAAGAAVPDLTRIDLPPEVGRRLRRGAEALRCLHAAWPTPTPAPAVPGSGSADDSPLRAIGRFRIRRELGRGGFGVVYLAHDPVLDREVAVKVPHPGGLDPEAGHRLAVEAQAAARLGHPNIVPVHESGTADGVPYVVSDYCPGISLADWLQRSQGPVPWPDAARLVAALARGVHHAHARGVLHRDLKPANVLLTATEAGPAPGEPAPGGPTPTLPLAAYVPRVADFGMAKLFLGPGSPHTTTGVIRGTPAYMAPEQAAGGPRDLTTAIDVYALGAVLYELLTRRPPFAAETPLATLDMIRTRAPIPPRALRSGLPADLETVCLKCLEKDPARRYTAAGELADDLDRLLRGEPVLARRATALERVVRAVRRYPAVAGLSVLLALALIAGLVVTTALWQRTKRERDRAEQHLVQLLDAYDETATATMDDHDLRAEELLPLRKQLLTELADRLDWVEARLSRDPADRPQLARCQHRLASVLFHLGRLDESRAAAGRAVETYEGLVRGNPNDTAARYWLTAALMSLANAEQDDDIRRRAADRAREAYATYAALPPEIRGPAGELDVDFAAFLYDLAVTARGRGDYDAALGYLAESCDRLRPLSTAGPPHRLRALSLLTHALQFRAQILRCMRRTDDAVASGREALAVAEELCREQPGDYVAWRELSGAYNEYGLALQWAGQRERAVEVWREGYERLGRDDVRESARGRVSVLARQASCRLMIAFNLGLSYSWAGNHEEAAVWFRTSLDTARTLLFVMPGDQQLWYTRGMCCANLVQIPPELGDSPAPLSLHLEGITSLEKALEMKPDDHYLRSVLGLCWEFYATALAEAREYAAALVAQARAVAYQAGAVSAAPGVQSYRDRLGSHLVNAARLVIQIW